MTNSRLLQAQADKVWASLHEKPLRTCTVWPCRPTLFFAWHFVRNCSPCLSPRFACAPAVPPLLPSGAPHSHRPGQAFLCSHLSQAHLCYLTPPGGDPSPVSPKGPVLLPSFRCFSSTWHMSGSWQMLVMKRRVVAGMGGPGPDAVSGLGEGKAGNRDSSRSLLRLRMQTVSLSPNGA